MNKILILMIYSALINPIYSMAKTQAIQDQVLPSIENYAKNLKKKTGIQMTAYGVNWAGLDHVYDEKVHLVDVGFCIDKQINVTEARALFYKVVDGLLDTFNSRPEFQECFYHYPVGYEDLFVRLSFDYQLKGHLKKGNVGMISILNNKITYFTVDADGVTLDLVMRPVVPGVFMGGGFSSRVHSVTKPLPEVDVIESHETTKKQM